MGWLPRHSALPVGVVLFVLGVGNWIISGSKILEYTDRAESGEALEGMESPSDFPALTPRTNATLLARLHRGLGEYSLVDAKLDFYRLVQSGGRLIAVIGLFLIGIALLQRWRAQRLTRPTGLAPPENPAA